MSSQMRSKVLRYTLLSRDALSADDMELYELVHLSGVVMDPNVYKILLDLLRMNVTPTAIEKMLKNMITNQTSAASRHGTDDRTASSSSSLSSTGGHREGKVHKSRHSSSSRDRHGSRDKHSHDNRH